MGMNQIFYSWGYYDSGNTYWKAISKIPIILTWGKTLFLTALSPTMYSK
jgi:hypothetical protein